MLVPNNLQEVVWSDEVEDQEEAVRDAFIGVKNIHARLKAQGAPQELLETFFDLREDLDSMMRELREVRACFPPKPAKQA